METKSPERREAPEREEELRPKFGARIRPDRERVPTFRGQLARAIARHGGPKKDAGRAASKRGRIAVRPPDQLSRRCVIKARYVSMTGNGPKIAKAHLAYLERDGVERDGSPGQLYGADLAFDVEAFRAPVKDEPRQFRFIVSPEDAHLLDLTEFTRQLMAQVEKDTGRRLDWAAVNHYNTGNPHVHIVVRGLDRDGDEVRIDGRYIAQEMRWRAQEIVTRELGRRPEIELSPVRNPEIERGRFTHLDRVIESVVRPEGTVSLNRILAEPGGEGRSCVARLQSLERFGIATNDGAGVWRLEPEWQQSLKNLGERNDVIDRLRPLIGDRAIEFRIIDEQRPANAFEGRVVAKGLDDELVGRMFLAIKTAAGESIYLRLPPEIAEPLREGDSVRVGFDAERWIKPADRIIERFARENQGIYDPARHRQVLENLDSRQLSLGGPTPAQRVEANVRRLERLERYGLVAKLPDGRWRIRPDLLIELEDRERTHPRPQLRVQKIDLERTTLGDFLAERHRMTFVAEPARFHGRVVDRVLGRSGQEYLLVANDARKEFTLVAKPPDWERLKGRAVVVSLDRERRLVIDRDQGLSR
jgi:type IV secretory pathway VirD2 relaxase